jgi:ADP-ribose pyrophosphatase YjhB (NUDIX family)
MKNELAPKGIESTRWYNLSQQNFIPQVSIDCVIFGYQDRQLKVLIPKLSYKGDFWTLPSGFVLQDEDIDQAAERILSERTSINGIYLEQFQVFGKANRSSKEFINLLKDLNIESIKQMDIDLDDYADYHWFTQRFISIGYYALVDINNVIPQKSILDESIEWYNIHEIPPLVMDYNEIVEKALKALRSDIDEKLNIFNLLPEKFTIADVQEIYETVFERTYVRTNFQKKILEFNVLERLEKKFTGAANKAPYLYRFKDRISCK